jgi:hypothetical protein
LEIFRQLRNQENLIEIHLELYLENHQIELCKQLFEYISQIKTLPKLMIKIQNNTLDYERFNTIVGETLSKLDNLKVFKFYSYSQVNDGLNFILDKIYRIEYVFINLPFYHHNDSKIINFNFANENFIENKLNIKKFIISHVCNTDELKKLLHKFYSLESLKFIEFNLKDEDENFLKFLFQFPKLKILEFSKCELSENFEEILFNFDSNLDNIGIKYYPKESMSVSIQPKKKNNLENLKFFMSRERKEIKMNLNLTSFSNLKCLSLYNIIINGIDFPKMNLIQQVSFSNCIIKMEVIDGLFNIFNPELKIFNFDKNILEIESNKNNYSFFDSLKNLKELEEFHFIKHYKVSLDDKDYEAIIVILRNCLKIEKFTLTYWRTFNEDLNVQFMKTLSNLNLKQLSLSMLKIKSELLYFLFSEKICLSLNKLHFSGLNFLNDEHLAYIEQIFLKTLNLKDITLEINSNFYVPRLIGLFEGFKNNLKLEKLSIESFLAINNIETYKFLNIINSMKYLRHLLFSAFKIDDDSENHTMQMILKGLKRNRNLVRVSFGENFVNGYREEIDILLINSNLPQTESLKF